MAKRALRDDDVTNELHPAKIARRLSGLKLSPEDPEDGSAPLHFVDDDGMDGVEARDFVYLNKQDVLDAINGVEIDDRFMKIPKSVTDASRAADLKDMPYFERPTHELIPYRPPRSPTTDASEDHMMDDDR